MCPIERWVHIFKWTGIGRNPAQDKHQECGWAIRSPHLVNYYATHQWINQLQKEVRKPDMMCKCTRNQMKLAPRNQTQNACNIKLSLPQSYIRNREPKRDQLYTGHQTKQAKSYFRNREPKCDKLYTGHETNPAKELHEEQSSPIW
jgi:hypothetical protein